MIRNPYLRWSAIRGDERLVAEDIVFPQDDEMRQYIDRRLPGVVAEISDEHARGVGLVAVLRALDAESVENETAHP